MSTKDDTRDPAHGSTRRQMIAGSLLAFGGLAASRVAGQSQPSPPPAPAEVPDGLRTTIHQEVDYGAAPGPIYGVLLDSGKFSACTGLAAVISPDEGGAFSMFGGIIVGRNVELVPDKRIVQAWRPAYWKPGVYSLVKFELVAKGAGTTVVLDHTGFPKGLYASLSSGWGERYWDPLRKFLG
jgi:activator of HSP90 ATPase